MVAVDEYDRLRRLDEANAPAFTVLLLAIPRDDREFERPDVKPWTLSCASTATAFFRSTRPWRGAGACSRNNSATRVPIS